MKSFADFLKEEISIRGNKGVPAEKLRDIERKGAEKVRGLHPGQVGGRLMELLRKSERFINGKQDELQNLAKRAVRKYFGLVLDNVDIEVDLTTSGNEIDQFMKTQNKNAREKSEKIEKDLKDKLKANIEKLKDKNLTDKQKNEIENRIQRIQNYLSGEEKLDPNVVKLAVDKRKLMNNFIQGEAKNVKAILHTDEVKDGLKTIYGETKWREAFDTWDEMTKLADKLDWLLDPHMRAMQMERNPSGFAGAVSTERPAPNFDDIKSEEEKEEEESCKNEIFDKMEKGEIPKDSEEVRKALKKSVIRAKGVDFPMLLHELVKGVYELITDIAMPSSKALAKEVHRQTSSFADEAEDWKYGPYLAEDLNNFIMKNPKVQKYPNVKEYVFARLIDRNRWTDEECLLNLKNIFLESPEGRRVIDMLVDEVVDAFDEYNRQLKDWERKQQEEEMRKRDEEEAEKWAKNVSKEDESDIDKLVKKSLYGEETKDEPKKSYDEMSIAEIQREIEKAVEEENYELAGELTQKYLKGESKKVWEMELMRINESHRHHSRRINK